MLGALSGVRGRCGVAERVSWLQWAHSLTGIGPTEMLVAVELARLADWRGEAIVPVAHLASVTSRSTRSVKRALASLEGRGALARRRRRWSGRQAASSVRLLDYPVLALVEEDVPVVRFVVPDVSPEGRWVSMEDNEGIREAVAGAVDEGWRGEETAVVVRSLDHAVEQQMSGSIRAGMVFSRLSFWESKADTMGWAWEAVRESTGQILGADSPWAMWTAVTRRVTGVGRDNALPEGVSVDACDPALMPEGLALPGEVEVPGVALDDFEALFCGVVAALVEAGMPEVIAWAGMRRVVELSLRDVSRRHQLAGEDPRMEDLGVRGRVGREWMTLLVGSRRGARPPVLQIGDEELAERARRLVNAYREAERTTVFGDL